VTLKTITFPAPGFLGLNKARQDVPLTPEWATEARNVVIDDAGRLAARKGWENQTGTPIGSTPAIAQLHEYVANDGTVRLIAATASDLYDSSDDGDTWTSRKGALSPTTGNWQFVNYNGKVIGANISHGLITKTGAGNFATLAATTGTIPANPVCVLAAFGRLWTISSDFQTLKWSALLDETKWHADDGAGTQNLYGTPAYPDYDAEGDDRVVFSREL